MAVESSTLTPILLTPSPSSLTLNLHRLESFLFLLGFHTSSSSSSPPLLSIFLSSSAFLTFGIITPSAAIYLSRFSNCSSEYQIDRFDLCSLVSGASLAAVSLVCVSKNLYKYGIRKFLFVDQHHGQLERFQNEYVQKIQVSSIVQVVGVVLCLHSAAKISHRAQGVASVASKWHALITCSSNDSSQPRITNGSGNPEVVPASTIPRAYSESDLESLDNVTLQTSSQAASYLTSYQRRQSLVMYLQSNPGGITIFGWTVDRGLINTIFFIELSLVLFVLGKTIVLAK